MKKLSITQQIDALVENQELRIQQLEAEVEHWKEKYWAEVYRSIQHGEQMMGSFIKAAIEGVIAPKANP